MMLQKILKNNYLFLCVLIGISLLNGFFVFYPITDGDIFWHLAAGREIVTKKALIYYDPFSFVPLNTKWIDVHWLFEIIIYLIEKIGGMSNLILCKAFIISLSTFFIALPFKNCFPKIIIMLFFANLIFFQRYLIPMRPIFVSLFLISVCIFSYEKYLITNKKSYLLLITLCQIIWVNSQGLFMLGPLLAFCYGYGEIFNKIFALQLKKDIFYYPALSKRDLFILSTFPFLLIGVSLFNPYHIKVFSLSLRLLSQINPSNKNIFSDSIAENTPLIKMFTTKNFLHFYITLFTFFLFIISLFCAKNKIRFSHTILALLGFTCAIMAYRNGIIFTFLSLPALFWNFLESISSSIPQKKWRPILNTLTGILLLSLIIGIFIHIRFFFLWQKPISPFSIPSESIKYLQTDSTCNKPLFNADRYGGYLIWKLYPELQISYDTRWSMRNRSYFIEYIYAINSFENFENLCKKYGFTSILLPLAPIDDYLILANKLYHSSKWELIYADGIEALFTLDSCNNYPKIDLSSNATVDSITQSLFQRFGKNRYIYLEALFYLKRFCSACKSREK